MMKVPCGEKDSRIYKNNGLIYRMLDGTEIKQGFLSSQVQFIWKRSNQHLPTDRLSKLEHLRGYHSETFNSEVDYIMFHFKTQYLQKLITRQWRITLVSHICHLMKDIILLSWT